MNSRNTVLADSWTEAVRHLRALPRNLDLIMFATVQPIMFIVLFNYVFGGAIATPGFDSYTQFMLPGIFAQTILFGTTHTAIGLTTDRQKGFMDRLRTLPISQSSILIGRTISDFIRNVGSFCVMMLVAFIIGFRFEGGLSKGLLACVVLLAFSYSFSWIQAVVGLSVNTAEAANGAGFIVMFPMTFVSSAFVPIDSMPGWMQTFAKLNPFTSATNAARALFNGTPVGNDLVITMSWAAAITLIFGLLANLQFAKASD